MAPMYVADKPMSHNSHDTWFCVMNIKLCFAEYILTFCVGATIQK